MNTTDIPPADRSWEGYNLAPFASMAGGWLGPLLMFWLYVWGPLRPFAYPAGDLLPGPPFTLAILVCAALWWVPSAYFRTHAFEQSGRVYDALGVRQFRRFVPDGDLANRWVRRRDPAFRIIRNRLSALSFIERTKSSERGHLVLLALGLVSAAFALAFGWYGWAVYLTTGNIVANVYPIMLQRYTRMRTDAVLRRPRQARAG